MDAGSGVFGLFQIQDPPARQITNGPEPYSESVRLTSYDPAHLSRSRRGVARDSRGGAPRPATGRQEHARRPTSSRRTTPRASSAATMKPRQARRERIRPASSPTSRVRWPSTRSSVRPSAPGNQATPRRRPVPRPVPAHRVSEYPRATVRAAIGRLGVQGAGAAGTHFAMMWTSDVLLYKALGIAPWPWEWSLTELAPRHPAQGSVRRRDKRRVRPTELTRCPHQGRAPSRPLHRGDPDRPERRQVGATMSCSRMSSPSRSSETRRSGPSGRRCA